MSYLFICTKRIIEKIACRLCGSKQCYECSSCHNSQCNCDCNWADQIELIEQGEWMSERNEKNTTPVDGIIVLMTWHCAICKQNWQQYIDQGTVRRMPSYVHVGGRKIETRRPDGSMLRAHEECANRMLAYMEAREVKREERKKKNRIIESGEWMKPSKLKKDTQSCVRINSEIKDTLKKKGKSPQKIVDEFIDKKFKIDKELNLKGLNKWKLINGKNYIT